MSLHTKYRPSTFEDVLGQNHIIPSLRQVVKQKRAHTFLFTGPSGTGKTTLARILANSFAGGQTTVANLEEVDAATKSGVDDVRAVVNRSYYHAVGNSPVKSIIIDECHRLSGSAWTILLKPIEEPPAHVFWLLCTTEPGKIPRTIITRCLRYELRPVSEELIYELLTATAEAEKLEVSEEILEAIAEASAGSPRQGLVFLEACAGCETAKAAQAIMRSAAQSPEAVTLARFLIGKQGRTWAEAMRHVKALEGVADAESVRIALVNYLSVVLMNAKGDSNVRMLLGLLEVFITPYNSSDRYAPLLHSLGLALNLDNEEVKDAR